MQLTKKQATSRRLILDKLKRHAHDSAQPCGSSAAPLTDKVAHISALFDRLHYVMQYCHTLLRDQLSQVRCTHTHTHTQR